MKGDFLLLCILRLSSTSIDGNNLVYGVSWNVFQLGYWTLKQSFVSWSDGSEVNTKWFEALIGCWLLVIQGNNDSRESN